MSKPIESEKFKAKIFQMPFGKYEGVMLDTVKDIDPTYLEWLFDETNDLELADKISKVMQ